MGDMEQKVRLSLLKLRLLRRGHRMAGSSVFELGRLILWGGNTDL